MNSENIKITVNTAFVEEQSDPIENKYVYAYHISIANTGEEPAKLISRYWHITDELNEVQEVLGEGVVGVQPYLGPGESYSYTSGVVLKTSTGLMTGHYVMKAETGEKFKAPIPTFALVQPQFVH